MHIILINFFNSMILNTSVSSRAMVLKLYHQGVGDLKKKNYCCIGEKNNAVLSKIFACLTGDSNLNRFNPIFSNSKTIPCILNLVTILMKMDPVDGTFYNKKLFSKIAKMTSYTCK